MTTPPGVLLRHWRTTRRYSQLELATRAEISMKHLSYVETGRSKPSPEMVLHLARHLDIPLRDRNDILLAAGYAPKYTHSTYQPTDDNPIHNVVKTIVDAHTLPAVVVDSCWDLVAANTAASIFLEGIDAQLLEPPINVIRLSLHPGGLAPRVVNFEEYAAHVLNRAERVLAHHHNHRLHDLLVEFEHLRQPPSKRTKQPGILLPLELRTRHGIINMFSTITTFGSPRDITLEELAIETFYPADPESQLLLAQLLSATGNESVRLTV